MREYLFIGGLLLVTALIMPPSCSKGNLPDRDNYPYSKMLKQTIDMRGKEWLELVNLTGTIEIQGWLQPTIELQAAKQAETQKYLENMQITIEESPMGVRIRSEYPKHLKPAVQVNYLLKVPVGIRLTVDQGAGTTRVTDYETTASIELNVGAGDFKLDNVNASKMQVNVGAGDVELIRAASTSMAVNIGTGNLKVHLLHDASFRIIAQVGVGGVTIKGFPNTQLKQQGFNVSVQAALGSGEGVLKFHVGVGDIEVSSSTVSR